MTLTERYGNFLVQLNGDDLPDNVCAYALDLLADWVANAVAGFDTQIGRALRTVVEIGQNSGQAVLLGNLQTVDPLSAALINGGASHAVEFDDAHREGLYHPGAPVIAAAWAAAGVKDFSGKQLIAAIVAGYEISMRLAEAVNPGHYKIWHTTGTIGTFGAAASAAYCLGLDAAQSTGALGLAGTQASGLWEILPDAPQAKGLHSGKAAHSGLLAACLAAKGLSGPTTILEGTRGFFAAMVPQVVDHSHCCKALGKSWWLPKITIKAYPVCGHTMPAIEAALRLSRKIKVDTVKKIEVRAHPVAVEIAGNPAPKTEAEAKFSIAYCVAIALEKGEVTQKEFSPDMIGSTQIQQLMGKIDLVPDAELPGRAGCRPARVTLIGQDGQRMVETADVRKGDPENPLSEAEKHKKFIDLVAGHWGPNTGEAIYQSIKKLPYAKSVRGWLETELLPRRTLQQ